MTARCWLHQRLFPQGAAWRVGFVFLGWQLLGHATGFHHIGDYSIHVWAVEQGLPQISVTSIAQTPDGYLWLSTFNGLARFDGIRFTVFDNGNTPVLGSSRISQLTVDPAGALWIVTEAGGIVCMVGDEFNVYRPEDGPAQPDAAAVVSDLQGRLFLIDRNGELNSIGPAREPSATGEGSLDTADEQFLLLDSAGRSWVGKGRRATRSEHALMELRATDGSSSPSAELLIQCATASRQGGLWLTTRTGLYRFKDGQFKAPIALPPDAPSDLHMMIEDLRGNLWIGSAQGGLLRYSPDGQWQRFNVGTGLADNHVAALLCDREGNVWLGTGRGGLHRFKPRRIRVYDELNGLSGNTVTSVTEDRQGRVWIGVNGGGVNCSQDGEFWPVKEPARLSQHRLVYSVLADRDDGIWIGLYGRGALRLHGGKVTGFTFEEGCHRATPLALFEDHAGAIWLGGERGLQRHWNGQFELFTRENGMSHDEVRALAEDTNGTLFIGTSGGGLNSLRAGEFSCHTERDGLPDNHIGALWMDRDDSLWIGTVNGGLCRFRDGRFATVTINDGLPSNTIGALCEDDLGYLWLGTNRGLVRLHCQELNDFLDGLRATFTHHVFDQSDGLNSIDCSGGVQPACVKSSDGKLWFATVKGVAVVDPNALAFNPLPPLVVIEEVAVQGVRIPRTQWARMTDTGPGADVMAERPRPIPTSPRLTIPPDQRRLEVQYAGLSLVAPEKVRFRYRLIGLDDQWSEARSSRAASYPYIPPGNYRFEVIASNNDGVWNDIPAVLPFTVLPYFWETQGFKALALLGFCGGMGWLVRLGFLRHMQRRLERFRHQQVLENERSRIAQDIHDDLGARLTQISLLTEFARRSIGEPAETQSYLDQIARRSRDMTQAMDEVVWTVDPAKDSVEGLLNYLGPLSEELLQGTAVCYRLDLPLAVPTHPISAKARHDILLAVKEALNNSLKHADATEIWIRGSLRGTFLSLRIEDNGSGFEPEQAAVDRVGHGLQNMRQRIENLGGTFEAVSRFGEGTRIQMEIDLSRNM